VTTRGIALLGLPVGTRLRLGATAVVELTGVRTPCSQMDGLRPGLMAACVGRDERGDIIRRAGVMGVVVAGGAVRAQDAIAVEHPAGEWRALRPI
jgi:MOSC domain-containing protein YiiM